MKNNLTVFIVRRFNTYSKKFRTTLEKCGCKEIFEAEKQRRSC